MEIWKQVIIRIFIIICLFLLLIGTISIDGKINNNDIFTIVILLVNIPIIILGPFI